MDSPTEAAGMPSLTLLDLPDSLIGLVFSFVPTASQLSRLTGSCRRLRALLDDQNGDNKGKTAPLGMQLWGALYHQRWHYHSLKTEQQAAFKTLLPMSQLADQNKTAVNTKKSSWKNVRDEYRRRALIDQDFRRLCLLPIARFYGNNKVKDETLVRQSMERFHICFGVDVLDECYRVWRYYQRRGHQAMGIHTLGHVARLLLRMVHGLLVAENYSRDILRHSPFAVFYPAVSSEDDLYSHVLWINSMFFKIPGQMEEIHHAPKDDQHFYNGGAPACRDTEVASSLLKEMKAAVLARCASHSERAVSDRLRAIHHVLFEEYGFQGNATDYYDMSNSLLPDVLERHTGLPITIAIVYALLCRSLDIDVEIIGLPGHVICRIPALTPGPLRKPATSKARRGMPDFNHFLNSDVNYEEVIRRPDSKTKCFVDVFNKGRLLSEKDCVNIIISCGAAPIRRYFAPLRLGELLERVGRNMYNVIDRRCSQSSSSQQLRLMNLQYPAIQLILDLLGLPEPNPSQNLLQSVQGKFVESWSDVLVQRGFGAWVAVRSNQYHAYW
jgi:Transglutaminase-like superfamily